MELTFEYVPVAHVQTAYLVKEGDEVLGYVWSQFVRKVRSGNGGTITSGDTVKWGCSADKGQIGQFAFHKTRKKAAESLTR